MKRWRKTARRLFCAALLLPASLLIYLRQGADFAHDIRIGKLRYTARAGWVNSGHARPEGVRVFTQALSQLWRDSGGAPFDITYGQYMDGHYFGLLGVQSQVERTYRVIPPLTETELDRVAFGIFREVSESFETLQGSFPNALDAQSQDSSFREGDLMGDRIAFFRALRGYSARQVQDWIQPLPPELSLLQLRKLPLAKERRWKVSQELAGGPLDGIHHDPAWFAAHALLVTEKQTWFRFYIVHER